MKYLLLIYTNPPTWAHPTHHYQEVSDHLREQMDKEFEELMGEISGSGELVDAAPLAAPEQTKTFKVREGALSMTDGPFAEVKEQLAGFFILDCATPERAQEIASRFPDWRFGAVELRPYYSG